MTTIVNFVERIKELEQFKLICDRQILPIIEKSIAVNNVMIKYYGNEVKVY